VSKISMLVAFGAGYVLGAKAGRERYREIRQKAEDLWRSDTVQQQRENAQQVAKTQASKAQEAAKDRLPAALGGRQGSPDGGAPSADAERTPGAASGSSAGEPVSVAGTTASRGTGAGPDDAGARSAPTSGTRE
jgi:hypothetical protein